MPKNIQSLNELPEQIKTNLPKHAQEIWRETYNSAYEEYDYDEEIAAKIAWGSVRRSYKKTDSGEWKARK